MPDSIFPLIKRNNIKSGIINGNERNVYLYPIIYKFLNNKISGWSVCEYFDNDINEIALYAFSDLARMIIKDLSNKRGKIQSIYITDKRYIDYGKDYYGIEIISVNQLICFYKQHKIKKIVVCSAFCENEIIQELIELGINSQDIISVVEILYSTDNEL